MNMHDGLSPKARRQQACGQSHKMTTSTASVSHTLLSPVLFGNNLALKKFNQTKRGAALALDKLSGASFCLYPGGGVVSWWTW